MIGWHFAEIYSPIISIFFGTTYFFLFYNIGNIITKFFRINVVNYNFYTNLILGYFTLSFFNSLLLSLNLFYYEFYAFFFVALIITTYVLNYKSLINLIISLKKIKFNFLFLLILIICLTHFLKSISPESRSDELGYHFLIIQRIIEDNQLKFYPLPWEAAINFQFYWHYNNIINFLFNLPESSKVISFYFNLSSLALIYKFLYIRTSSIFLSFSTVLLIITGGYSLMFLNTFGPHSILIFSCTLLYIFSFEYLRGKENSTLLISIIATVVLSSKATTILIVLLIFSYIFLFYRIKFFKNTLIFALIPLIFFLPILLWTFIHSGSPFGSATEFLYFNKFQTNEIIRTTLAGRAFNDFNYYRIIFDFYYFNPIILIMALTGFFVLKNKVEVFFYAIFCIQIIFWLLYLPKEQRHLNYMQVFIFLIIITNIYNALVDRKLYKKLFNFFLFLSVIPWLAMNIWVSQIFIFNFFNKVSLDNFLTNYTGLYMSYKKLDTILPEESELYLGRLLNDDFQITYHARAPFYYSSRKILFSENELIKSDTENKYFILLYSNDKYNKSPIKKAYLPLEYKLGDLVYKKKNELYYPERTPRQNRGTKLNLEIYKIIKNKNN